MQGNSIDLPNAPHPIPIAIGTPREKDFEPSPSERAG